jgi:hypothetical protein
MLVMMCFGLGTMPTLLLTGAVAHQLKVWIQKAMVRNINALLIISFGLWTTGWTIAHLGHTHNASQQQSINHKANVHQDSSRGSTHKH